MVTLASAKNPVVRTRKVRPATSKVNELDCGASEFGVVLENRAVAGVRVDGEFRPSDPTVHVFGEGGGDHAVQSCRLAM
jgi:hypothetical protein